MGGPFALCFGGVRHPRGPVKIGVVAGRAGARIAVMLDADSYHAALDALDWQIDLGADEAILDAPVNRYETAAAPKAKAAEAPTPVAAPEPSVEAQKAANAATDLDGLKAALAAFQGFEIRRGARNLVFSDGDLLPASW